MSDIGSFKKAAMKIEMSSPAIIKQITALESTLGVELFKRTNQGVILTESGKVFYDDANNIIKYAKESMVRAKNAKPKTKKIIRIGIAPLTSGKVLNELWCEILNIYPDLIIEFVSFEGTLNSPNEIFEHLGKDVDIVAGGYDESVLEKYKCEALKIKDEPVCCAVPVFSPLYRKKSLSVSDLYGENLMMLKENVFKTNDILREDLLNNHANINIIDFESYNFNTFNKCVNDNNIIIALNLWENLHPLIKVIPVEWDYTLSYGLFYKANSSNDVKEFLNGVTQVLE